MSRPTAIYVMDLRSHVITTHCQKCNKALAVIKDSFLIGMNMEGSPFHHMLAVDPPITCCGEERPTLRTFETLEKARAEKERITTWLATASVDELKLIPIPPFRDPNDPGVN